jgi:hypothetical protein
VVAAAKLSMNNQSVGAKALETVSRELSLFSTNLTNEAATWDYISDHKIGGLHVINKVSPTPYTLHPKP